MNIRLDIRELSDFQATLKSLPYAIDQKVLEMTLRKAAQPLYRYMVAIAPVGKRGYERVSLKHRGGSANEYRRGGATRRDIRIKTVTDSLSEAKVLIGISKASGKVGWRYHFIAQGVAGSYRAKAGPRPFVEKAGDAMASTVTAGVVGIYGNITQRTFQKYNIAA